MAVSRDKTHWDVAPLAHELKIAIVGGGLGGTCTALGLARRGFRVTVFEAAPEIKEVGAGINIGPNFSRVLEHLGVHAEVTKNAVQIIGTSIRRYANDQELNHTDFARMIPKYGHPPHVAHRADTMKVLYDACKATGKIDFRLGQWIADIDLDQPAIKLPSGEWFVADVVIAADGIKSNVRSKILERLGLSSDVKDTGQAAYRILLPYEKMAQDPELKKLIEEPVVTRWVGPGRHIIAYPISDHKIYNISTAHPDANFAEAPSTAWTTRGDKSAMMDCYGNFSDRVKRMLDLCPEGEVCEWKLRVHAPLPTWVEKRVAMVGDACHPTLPHLAQGAAQAAEDADVVATVLSKITSKTDIDAAFRVYEKVRKSRAERIVEGAAASGRRLHKADGEEQQERDKLFESVKEGGQNPDSWADNEIQDFLFGDDVVQTVERDWKSLLAQAQQERRSNDVH